MLIRQPPCYFILVVQSIVEEHKNIFAISIISQHYDDTSCWNPSSSKAKTCTSYIINTMFADDLAKSICMNVGFSIVWSCFYSLQEPSEKICMRWRSKSWPNEHYSNVTLELKQKDCTTDLVLTQTGIPDNEYDRTKEGWHQYYWEPIKMTFGFGARLF